jgi:D-alanine-D-alanine ligase
VVLESAADVAAVDFPYPVFAKPIAEGTGKGCTAASRCRNLTDLRRTARRLLARYAQPVIVEPFLPGREFTVGIVGTGAEAMVLAVMEIALQPGAEAEVYSYENKELCESRVVYGLAHDREALLAGETALAAYRALGCRDAGRVDMRSDRAGVPQFLEVNPLAGLHPTHSDLPILAGLAGIGYDDLLGRIVAACLARTGLEQTPVTAGRAVAGRAA